MVSRVKIVVEKPIRSPPRPLRKLKSFGILEWSVTWVLQLPTLITLLAPTLYLNLFVYPSFSFSRGDVFHHDQASLQQDGLRSDSGALHQGCSECNAQAVGASGRR